MLDEVMGVHLYVDQVMSSLATSKHKTNLIEEMNDPLNVGNVMYTMATKNINYTTEVISDLFNVGQ